MMFVGAKFCSHCGARADRAEAEQGSKLLCPRCRGHLSSITVGQTLLQECPKCEGIWADATSLAQIRADREQQAAVLGMPAAIQESGGGALEKNIRYVPCPVCRKLMNRVNFARCSQVVVDVCREHGTWFDKDELRRIVEFIRSGGLEQARAREIADLEDQRRRARADKVASSWDTRSGGPDWAGDYRSDGISAVARALRSLLG
jgi:Zn-finger nucleic acid-binding protein